MYKLGFLFFIFFSCNIKNRKVFYNYNKNNQIETAIVFTNDSMLFSFQKNSITSRFLYGKYRINNNEINIFETFKNDSLLLKYDTNFLPDLQYNSKILLNLSDMKYYYKIVFNDTIISINDESKTKLSLNKEIFKNGFYIYSFSGITKKYFINDTSINEISLKKIIIPQLYKINEIQISKLYYSFNKIIMLDSLKNKVVLSPIRRKKESHYFNEYKKRYWGVYNKHY